MQSAIRFWARGLPKVQIAKHLGRDRNTIAEWIEEHPEAVDEAVRQLTNPSDVFHPMLPLAAAAYRQALENLDAAVARDVFDRLYGKPIVREQRSERREVRIMFVDASDDEAIDGEARN